MTDRSAIEERFGFKSFVINKIELGCGDPHNGGRSVAILHIGADKLVYKPQSLAIDQAFYGLVAWIATRIDKAPATVPILSRPDRGWVAFINYQDCETSEDVDDCYRRLGSLVCLLHLCGASDIHFENVICNGNQPVIVDLETTMTGLPKTVMAENFVMRSGAALYDTVLWIGYLPCPTYIGGGRIDLSAAGAVESQLSPLKALALRRNDRDDVGLESEPSQIEAQGSVPRLGGVAAPLHLHLDAFLSGFDDTYRALETAREELLAPAGVLAAFKPLSFRWVARNTATYATLLRSSYHPTMLRDGVDHEMAFASLRLGNFKPARLKQIAAAEIRDLWRSDIPYFTARATSRSVWTSSGERIDDLFRASPFDEMISRLQGFGEIERRRQVAFIRTSVLAARLEGGPEQPNDPIALGPGPSSEADINWLGLAVEIGDTLAKQAIFVDGAPFWVAPTSFGTDYYTASIVNETLYDGVAGLAVFFSELAARTGERRFANLAACARLGFKSADAGGKSAHNIGAFDGAAGLVFAELRLGAASGDYDERYIRRQLAKLVERARGDEAVDVVNGVAGVGVVALRALSALGRNHVAEDLIQVCGDRLIELAQPGDAGASWTAGAIGKNLTGFSHGAAGVAWALAQLGEHTGDVRYFDYCNAALTFEASTFDADARNWRDLRGGLVHATTWCHGAPGTTLARQAIRGFGAGKLDQGALEDEIATGLAAVRRLGAGGSHCLCHGAFGNLAPLIRDGHIEDANKLARRAVEEYRGEGRWRCGIASYAPTPGLMSGLAGIGMGLLSMAAPSTPDILTLEL